MGQLQVHCAVPPHGRNVVSIEKLAQWYKLKICNVFAELFHENIVLQIHGNGNDSFERQIWMTGYCSKQRFFVKRLGALGDVKMYPEKSIENLAQIALTERGCVNAEKKCLTISCISMLPRKGGCFGNWCAMAHWWQARKAGSLDVWATIPADASCNAVWE